MRHALLGGLAALILAGLSPIRANDKEDKQVPGVLNFTMKSLSGEPVDLSKYQGKVVLMVNVASKCGYTPQYKGLEKLYEKYGKDGLVVLGFPADNFGHQEPGTDQEISQFCSSKYGVTFPMFSKVSVKGDDECPLYRHLTSAQTDPKFAGPIKWNFTKFLINSKGEIVHRFESKVKPDSREMTTAIEQELAKK
jgi:glutathione peroxidase